MGRRHGGFGGPIRFGSGSAGLARAQQLRPDQLEQLLGFPSVDRGWSVRVGKKAAGRLLDGRTHDEFPLTKLHAAEQEAREPSLFPPT